MGIYVFNRQVLIDVLADENGHDFGKHIIPGAIGKYHVNAYIFQGYWEDIGTILAFFEANLALTDIVPPFNFFDRLAPVYTRTRFLPASKINAVTINRAVISDGCIITDAHLERCIIGVRSIINEGAELRDVVLMGADYYEGDPRGTTLRLPPNSPPIGIGRNCVIKRAIIDKNARIGDGVVITPEGKPDNYDSENFYIRDGVVVVPKNAVLPSGSWV